MVMKENIQPTELKRAFEPIYGRQLSSAEVLEIDQNLKGVFGLLMKIDQRNEREKANEQNNGSSNKTN